MPDESLSLPDLPTTNPAAAYADDVARLHRPAIGMLDDAWLILGHCLSRMPALPADGRREALLGTADALAASALSLGLASTSPTLRVAAALRAVAEGNDAGTAQPDPVSETVFAVQRFVEELEIAGGFTLAYAMLIGLETAFDDVMSPRVRGNLVAQQGRAARQLGLMDLARELYTSSMEQGYECDAKDVVARGLIGLALVAATRGNYPAARDNYERALANAELAQDHDLLRSAHHGLMSCGFASGDLDSAMVHGWNVLRLSIHPDTRAEALLNMAEICRLTGEHEVALRVFRVAIEWTSVDRVRLHALSAALQTAITLNRTDDAARFRTAVAKLMPTVADPYTQATIGIEFADSLHRLGDRAGAHATLARSEALAVEHSFHELVHHAERAAAQWSAAETAAFEVPTEVAPSGAKKRSRRSEHFRVVLRSLNGLTAASL